MIRLFLVLFILSSCVITKEIPEQKPAEKKKVIVPMNKNVYEKIVNKKYSHPFAIQGLKDAAEFRKAQKTDLENLSKEVLDAKLKHKVSFDKNFKNKLRANLKAELKNIEEFNSFISSMKIANDDKAANHLDPQYVFPQVKYNKLNIFLDHALNLSDEKLDKILNGKIIAEIYKGSYLLPANDVMENSANNPRADLTIPSTIVVMLETLKIINEGNYKKYIKNHLNSSSLFYWYKTPRGFEFDASSMFFAFHKGTKGMILAHNGYAFGGSAYGANVRKNFITMPHDCSSYISHIVDLGKDPFTKENYVVWTADGLNLNNFINDSYVDGENLKKNLTSYGLFAQKLEIVPLVDISSFKEGDILLFRTFGEGQNKFGSLGSGGHTGIVLGTEKSENGEDKIYLLGYSRNYENLGTGGFLLSAISLAAIQDESRYPVIFRYKGYNHKEEVKEDIIDVAIADSICEILYKEKLYKCDFGKNGATANKVEGDGKTPLGTFPLREVFYREDKIANVKSKLSVIPIEENYGWCDDVKSENYNKFIYLPAKNCASAENLYRTIDDAYDIIVPLGYNDKKIVKGKGSAIFLHAFKPNNEPTQGCIAVDRNNLLEILKEADENTKMRIQTY